MSFNFEINGLKELNKELKKLPEEFRVKSLAAAAGAAARVVRDEAKRLAPVDTGNLQGAIRVQKKKSPSKYLAKYQVNVKPKGKVTIITRGKKNRNNSTYYAQFIEEGTAKMPARPFMRTALAFKKREAVKKFRKVLDRKIALSNRKIARLSR